MALNYDFDIQDVMPEEIFADPAMAEMMQSIGIKSNSAGNKVVQFRHQATVDAILAGPPSLQAMFKAAGFGMVASRRQIPDGQYLAKEDGARTYFVGKIYENKHLLFDGGDESNVAFQGGFKFGDFMMQMMNAKPFDPQPTSFGSLRKGSPAPAAKTGGAGWGKGPLPSGERPMRRARPEPQPSAWTSPLTEADEGPIVSSARPKTWNPKVIMLLAGWAVFAIIGTKLLSGGQMVGI